MGVWMAEAPELEEVMGCHREVADAVRRNLSGGIAQGKINRWGATHAVLARSSKYARAAKLLLNKGHWEAPGALARTIFEDAAVLAYIHSRADQAEEFALLYLKSDFSDRFRLWKCLKRRGIAPRTNGKYSESDLETLDNNVRALREKLRQRKSDADGTDLSFHGNSWNGLGIRDTFTEGNLEEMYADYYAPLCTLVHASPFAHSFGFQDELKLDDSVDPVHERKHALWVVDGLVRALGVQLMVAKELIGVTPKTGMPDFEALLKQLRDTE